LGGPPAAVGCGANRRLLFPLGALKLVPGSLFQFLFFGCTFFTNHLDNNHLTLHSRGRPSCSFFRILMLSRTTLGLRLFRIFSSPLVHNLRSSDVSRYGTVFFSRCEIPVNPRSFPPHRVFSYRGGFKPGPTFQTGWRLFYRAGFPHATKLPPFWFAFSPFPLPAVGTPQVCFQVFIRLSWPVSFVDFLKVPADCPFFFCPLLFLPWCSCSRSFTPFASFIPECPNSPPLGAILCQFRQSVPQLYLLPASLLGLT